MVGIVCGLSTILVDYLSSDSFQTNTAGLSPETDGRGRGGGGKVPSPVGGLVDTERDPGPLPGGDWRLQVP